ncbi:MAG: ATP-binding cassette domain-containing protein, partial [Desulfobacterales bacterium]|nr:ATP-binding cassette domain-containing protein [Desulfobacterales bacterium]
METYRLLEVEGITKHFGGLSVLQDVTLNIDQGEIVGLIGPNGAGKTTLFNVITGIYPPNEGMIRFNGKNLVGLKSYQIC